MSNTQTLVETHGITVLDHLDMQVDIPVLSGLQRQGDVIVIPARLNRSTAVATTPVPAVGVPVVRGENGGNTHAVVADGPVYLDLINDGTARTAVLTVPDGSVAYLAHPEHGYAGIAPGNYTIGRQVEQADVIRQVAD